MVTKYCILAKGQHEGFKQPRQLSLINGERLLDRTIRLLKENGIKDIIVTGDYTDLDQSVKVVNPKDNTYDYKTDKGYWLDAFSYELLNEPICFIWGDVYFSEEAIKTIVNTDTDSTLFFCSHNNKSKYYIKSYDEPFAYKIVDTELFKKHIEIVKRLFDEGKTCRHPIVWEVYRSINGIDINTHKLTDNVVVINDITCDIDSKNDIEKIKNNVEFKPSKELSIIIPYYKTLELTEKLLNKLIPQIPNNVEVLLIDDGCNEKELDKYNIDIVHLKKNCGDSVARNTGIKMGKGKYIAFIDSDDLIANDYVETLLNTIKEHNEDIITFNWQDMNTGRVVERPNNYASWKSIYKKEIIPFFVEGRRFSSDCPFKEELDGKDLTRYYIDKVLYYYNSNRVGSLSWEKAEYIKKGGV